MFSTRGISSVRYQFYSTISNSFSHIRRLFALQLVHAQQSASSHQRGLSRPSKHDSCQMKSGLRSTRLWHRRLLFCSWRGHQRHHSAGSRELAYRSWACKAWIRRSSRLSMYWRTRTWDKVYENRPQESADAAMRPYDWSRADNFLGIKEYSEWPTIPQLYVEQQFIGGCDILMTMHQDGSLAKMLEEKGVVVPAEPGA